jgi:anti-anti-sigma factor
MIEDAYPVEWAGELAVVALPEHIGASNAGQVREELLSVINRGATTLIADMTATISCDHAGADAVIRAWQRAQASSTELRLVVTAQIVARVLSLSGLNRLVSVYPSLEAAMAARLPAAVAVLATRPQRAGQPPAAFPAATPTGGGAVPVPAEELLDALQDGVALTDDDGMIAVVSARLEDMFGYDRGELPGYPVESLVPAGLQEAHRGHRTAWALAPWGRPMGSGGQLAGLRKDGITFPVRVSLAPVTTADGPFTLVVIRDITRADRLEGLAGLARDAAAAEEAHLRLLDAVITGLFHAGFSLQAAMALPAGAARQRTGEALSVLEDIIRQIRGSAFAALGQPALPPGDVR